MKEIERLAEEYENNRVKEECVCTLGDGEYCEKCSPSRESMHAQYIAGFCKAREMALKLHQINLGSSGMCDFSAHDGEHKFENACALLGESEVKE